MLRDDLAFVARLLSDFINVFKAILNQRSLDRLLSVIDEALYNPFTTVAITKLLEMIGRSAYFLAWSIATALHSDINQTPGSGGNLSM